MCGRDYSTYTEEELQFRYLNQKRWRWPIVQHIPELRPNYNMCPTQLGPVLCVADGKLSFRLMRWGLVPGWAKTIKDADKYSMINAKSEEISEKRSYKAAFQKRRCIVPVSGFYEWKRTEDKKTPYAIHLKTDSIMSLAGIWEWWQSKESGEIVESFSLITLPANAFMEKIHSRMPLILTKGEEEGWLDPEISEPKNIFPLMKGVGSEDLACFEVSKRVNSPKNNTAENLQPIESK